MQLERYSPAQRGLKDIGWLKSNFILSFSGHYNPVRAGFGLLRVFNDDYVAPENGFGIHPHANMEIISVMLSGSMSHIDSLGYKETVHKDWVQIMSAGSGLRHEEHNVGQDEVNFLQIWIEPKLQNITPRYQRRFFPEEKRVNQLTTIVSNEEGQSHCWINQNAKLSLGYFEQGQPLTYSFNPLNKGLFVFNISGSFQVNDQPLTDREALGLWDTDQLQFSFQTDSRFLLIEVPINH
ncbi:pirin family protein [Rufibacter sediminis]|uniref:Pirin family protein n=1 Tax=Rufibacter sediminis TaxID=2762756 RepID=A0ABR6VQX8_9BACT|nr:pirin family protein [Rufibacter sediminis]MBC3539611.1 pirin family protein [Rufibacter sediminis]